MLFTGAYLLWMIQRVLLGPLNPRWTGLCEIGFREGITVAPLLAFMGFTGLWPAWILGLINETISRLFG